MSDGHREIMLVRNGERIGTDEEIAPLVEGIWALGIATEYSCQDVDGQVIIMFSTAEGAAMFLSIVANGCNDLADKVIEPVDCCHHQKERDWLLVPSVVSFTKECDDGRYIWTQRGLRIGMTVMFPRTDLAEVAPLFDVAPPLTQSEIAAKIRGRLGRR
jgi:hypothetical protein